MAVPENERGERKMQVFMKANDLVAHTIKVCANEKTFPPQYHWQVTADLVTAAKDIYLYAWEANDVYVKDGHGGIDPDKAAERKRLQELSIRKCDRFLALLQIAKRVCHLSSKRVKYWAGMTQEVRDLLKAWKNNDAKRCNSRCHTGGRLTSAQNVRLRSATRDNASNVWCVNTTGNVNNNNANNANRSAPGLRKHRHGKPYRKHGVPECRRRKEPNSRPAKGEQCCGDASISKDMCARHATERKSYEKQ